MTYSVHDEPDFERTYDEDDIIPVRKGDLRALLDLATGSMDFGSGFWDNEQVEVTRSIGDVLGIPLCRVTPANFHTTYDQDHQWEEWGEWKDWLEYRPLHALNYRDNYVKIGTRRSRRCEFCWHDEHQYRNMDGVLVERT